MTIVEITRDEFDSYKPHRATAAPLRIEERRWFATEDRWFLGVVTFDLSDRDWGFMVLGHDQEGSFRAIHVDVSLATQEEAEAQLLAAMEEKRELR
jgi:hypothetical protein